MNAVTGLYPFFMLGLRRMSQRAGALSFATFVVAAIAFLPVSLLLTASWFTGELPFDLGLFRIDTPQVLFMTLGISLCAASFVAPFFAAGVSDLFFRTDWRANSILLVSPMTSRSLFWGKYVLLATVGLPLIIVLVPPVGTLALGYLPSGQGFFLILSAGLAVYFVSTLYLAGFSRRWEAFLFWVFLIPLSALMNWLIWLGFVFADWIVKYIHTSFPNDPRFQALPQFIDPPSIPLWIPVVAVLVFTIVWLLRRGAAELDKMRTGKIPLGRLTKKSLEDFRKKQTAQWLRPAYTRADRTPRRELYIPVQPGLYAPTSTDHVFNLYVWLAFLSKGFVRWLLGLFPESIKENPIYVRHTARFRGFLAGYFEPPGMFKSKVVLGVSIVLFVGFISGLSSGLGFGVTEWILTALLVAGIGMALVSPIDAYMRLARDHAERMAWESMILAPISGRELLSGSFGVLLAHRWVPFLPAILYLVLIGFFAGSYVQNTLVVLLLVCALYFAGLSYAAGLSWLIANRWIAGLLLVLWGLGFFGLYRFIISKGFFGRFITMGKVLVHPSSLNYADLARILILAVALFGLGVFVPFVLGGIFDRFARFPLARRTEE